MKRAARSGPNDDGDPTDAYVALGEYTGELYSGNLNTEYDDGSVDSENK